MTPGVIGTARGQGPRKRPAAPASGGTDFVARRQNWGDRSSLRPCWRNGMIALTEQTIFGSVWHPSFFASARPAPLAWVQRLLRLLGFRSKDLPGVRLGAEFSAENFFVGYDCAGATARPAEPDVDHPAQTAPFNLGTFWLQCALRGSRQWLNWERGRSVTRRKQWLRQG